MPVPTRISVFISSFNQRAYLEEAIESVLAQTLPPWEVVVVDDASTDHSQDLIRGYVAKHPSLIRAYLHPHNLGVATNKAFAQKQVHGDYVTYLDGDDRFLPHKLEQEWHALQQRPKAKIAYSNFFFIDAAGNRTDVWHDAADDDAPTPAEGDVFEQVFTRSFPRQVVFRNELVARTVLHSVGPYDTTRRTHEDWDWKLRATRRFEAVYCPRPALEYRRHGGGLSQAQQESDRLAEATAVYHNARRLLATMSPPHRARLDKQVRAKFRQRAERVLGKMVREGRRWEALRFFLRFREWLPARWVVTILKTAAPTPAVEREGGPPDA